MHEYIWKVNLSKRDCLKLGLPPSFWTDIILAWCEVNYKPEVTETNVTVQSLWYNSLLKRGGKVPVNDVAIAKGILFIGDICKNGSIMEYEEFRLVYDDCISWFEYYKIVSVIPQQWKNLLKDKYNKGVKCKTQNYDRLLVNPKNASKWAYYTLMSGQKILLG